MNLCIVASGDFFSDYGGGQVYVKTLVDELIRQKDELDITLSVISFSSAFPRRHIYKEYRGIPIYELNQKGNIEELLSAIKPDIVHAHGEKLKVARVCRSLSIKCIITAHHGGLVCPAGTLLNTNDEICSIPADYKHCLKCYLRNTRTGLWWYHLVKCFSQDRMNRFGEKLRRVPFVPFLSPIGETGLIVSEKIIQQKSLFESATYFIAPSNAIADVLQRNGCPKEKISIIPHGIPIPPLHHYTHTPVHQIKFFYVGRINYVKGIHVLLKAFSLIDNNNIELHLIGGTGNKAELRYMKKLQRQFNKDSRIEWHGKMPYEQMNEATKDFHCLVHPAIYLEVFGLNISEALAQHKYVIATRCGGPEMQIHNESEGVLVAPNDADALKEAMINYISQPRQSDARVIDIETHVKQLSNLYFLTPHLTPSLTPILTPEA